MIRQLSVIGLAALLAVPLLAQTTPVVPPANSTDAKPAANGASLAETAKIIEETMDGQGQIEWLFTTSDLQGISTRMDYRISETQIDIATCTLKTRETTNYLIEPEVGITYSEGGKRVTGDNLSRKEIAVSATPLKQVVSVKVVDALEFGREARAARPDITAEVTPTLYLVILMTGGKDNTFHRELSRGKEAPKVWDAFSEGNRYTFLQRELADRVAESLRHAVELCGGGKKEASSQGGGAGE